LHRTRKLDPVDICHIGPLPCTTVSRTIINLAAVVP